MTITELEKASGVPRRTVHFYIRQGVLPPPDGAGGAARYGEEHLLRLRLIQELQKSHLKLAGIREAFEGAFQIDPAALTPATSPRDVPEWDSLGYVLLWNILEEKFRVPISSSDIIAIRNVEDLAIMLMEKTGLKN